jgi:hypothetical protein
MTDDPIQRAYDRGYADGRFDEREEMLTLLAENADALDATWKPIKRKSYEEKKAERLAEMEESARRAAKAWPAPTGPIKDFKDWPPVRKPGSGSSAST